LIYCGNYVAPNKLYFLSPGRGQGEIISESDGGAHQFKREYKISKNISVA